MAVTSDEKFAETVVFPFDKVFAKGKGSVKQDKVVSIKEGKGEEASELELASGETLKYRGEHTRLLPHPLHTSYCNPNLFYNQFSFSRPVPNGLDPLISLRVRPIFISSHHNGAKSSKPRKILSSLVGAPSDWSFLERLGISTR